MDVYIHCKKQRWKFHTKIGVFISSHIAPDFSGRCTPLNMVGNFMPKYGGQKHLNLWKYATNKVYNISILELVLLLSFKRIDNRCSTL